MPNCLIKSGIKPQDRKAIAELAGVKDHSVEEFTDQEKRALIKAANKVLSEVTQSISGIYDKTGFSSPPKPPKEGGSTTEEADDDGLKKSIQTGKEKKSAYYDRMVEDETLSEAIERQDAVYQEQSLNKAIEVSNQIVDDAIAANDVDSLYSETLKNWNKIPALMQVNLAERLMEHYAARGEDSKVKRLYNLIGAEAAAERGRSVTAYRTGRGEVQKAATAVIAEHADQKTKVLGKETEGKLKELNEALQVKDSELAKLKELLAEKIAQVERILSKGDTGVKNRIANRKSKVEAAKRKLSSLKIKTTGQANSITQVIGAAAWNAAIDTINASLDAGLTLANAIDKAIVAVKEHYKGDWDKDAFRAYIEGQLGKDADALNVDMEQFVKKGLKDIGADINAIVDSHYTTVDHTGKKLSDRFVNELGLDEKTAKNLETDIQNTLKSIVKERQQKVLSERLGSEPVPKNAKVKKKDLFDQIITDINRGALTDDMFTDLFADYYGFGKMTPEARQMLLDYADKMEKLAPYPEMYNRMANQFWNDLKKAGLDKNTVQSIYTDFLYHGALSGLTTQARSQKGSLMTNISSLLSATLASPKEALNAWRQFIKGLPAGLQSAYDVLKTGYRTDEFKEFKPTGDGYIAQKVNTKFSELIKNKDWAGVFTKIHMTLPAYALRALGAWDALLKSGNVRFHGYMINANKLTGTPEANEITKLYSESTDNKLAEQAKAEVEYLKAEGFEIPQGYEGRRVEELREQLMDENVVKRIYQRSSEGVLMSDPHGMAGTFYRWMQANLSEKKTDSKMETLGKMIGRSVFLIMRVPANFINMNIDYSPAGFYRAARGTLKYRDGIYQMTPEERRIQMIKATTGTSAAIALGMMLFDWDDEEGIQLDEDAPIQIYGRGMDKWKDNESIDPHWKPWSIRFKLPNGEWSGFYSFLDNPIGSMLAPLGIISDEIRFKDFQKKVKNREYEIPEHNLQYYGSIFANSSVGFLMSQSYQQGIQDLRDVLLPYANDYTKSAEKLEKIATRPIKTLAIPNMYQQFYNYGKAGLDNPEKYAKTTLEKLAKGTPIIESVMLDDDVDVFGYNIIKRFDVPLVPDVILNRVKDNIDYREGLKEWQLVHKYPEVIVKPFSLPRYINKKKFNDEHTIEFKQMAGEKFRNYVNGNYNYLNKLESDKLQIQLNYYRNEAYNDAKSRIQRKYYR